MKKIVILVFLFVSVLVFTQTVNAYIPLWPILNTPTPTTALLKLNPNLIHLLDTPVPSPTVTPFPTRTPTPTPTQKVEDTVVPTKEIIVTTDISVTPTSTIAATISVTPTSVPTSQKFPFSKKELAVAGVIGVLVLVIFFQSWPKIKKMLHDKTA